MKCLAVVGSANPKSVSMKIAQRFFDCFLLADQSITTTYFSLQDQPVRLCRGCESCFATGKCPVDDELDGDSLKQLKTEMLSSNLILLVSPIYFGNISGGMKCVIDRLSYWSHLMALYGKLGVGIVVSDGNSYTGGSSYLSNVMESLGLSVVDNIAVQRRLAVNTIALDSVLSQIAIRSQQVYCSNKYPITERQRLLFRTLQNKIQKRGTGAEFEYWKYHGYFDCESFDDLVSKALTIP